MAMAVMLFTSCLKNEEPQSLGTLREAKAELIKAQAAYKTAEIALIQAQVAYENAITEGVKVANELKAQQVEAQKIANKIQEVELAKKEAELEAEIAKLEVTLAEYEQDLAEIQQAMEAAAAAHEAAMIAAMQAIAEAQHAYEQALKWIEAENIGLTDEQAAVLKDYTSKIKDLEQKIYDQQVQYAQKYAAYQRLLLTNTYEDILLEAERDLEEAITDANEIVEAMDDIVAFFEAETTQELVEQAAAEEAVTALYKDSLAMYDAELDVIEEERIKINADKKYAEEKYVAPYKDSVAKYDAAFTTAWNDYVAAADEVVNKKVNATFTYHSDLEKYMTDEDLFGAEAKNAKNGKYTSTSTFSIIEKKTAAADSDKYTYSYAYQNSEDQANLLALYDKLYVAVYSNLHISPAVVEDMLNNAEDKRSDYNDTKEAYEEYKPIFDAVIETVPAVAAEYGIGEEDDMQTLTAELYKDLMDDFDEGEQIENTRWAEVLEAVVAYLEARVELDGEQDSWTESQTIGSTTIEVVVTLQEKLQNKYATEKDLLIAYRTQITKQLKDVARVKYGQYKVLKGKDDKTLPIEDQSLLYQWNESSKKVYGTALDQPLQMPIEDYFQDFSAVTVNADGKILLVNRADEVAKEDFKKMANSFGWNVVDAPVFSTPTTIPFYKVEGFEGGLWFRLQVLTAALNPELVELQEEVDAVLAAIDAQKVDQPAAVKAAADAAIANTTAVDAAIADLKAADKALADATKQYTASYVEKLKELDKEEKEIEHQKHLINIKLGASEQLHAIYMKYINEYIDEDGTVDLLFNPQNVAQFVYGLQIELAIKQIEYEDAMDEVATCEEQLEMVKLGIDEATVALAEKIASYEFDLERIEEQIAEYTLTLEYYQELLAEAIETFLAE